MRMTRAATAREVALISTSAGEVVPQQISGPPTSISAPTEKRNNKRIANKWPPRENSDANKPVTAARSTLSKKRKSAILESDGNELPHNLGTVSTEEGYLPIHPQFGIPTPSADSTVKEI